MFKKTLLLIVLVSALGLPCIEPALAANESSSNVITVDAGTIGATTTLGGTVVPLKEVTFLAQMPGRVEYIAGVEGDWFEDGTLLVALDNDDLLAMRQSAYAALAQARANWRNAHVQYTREVFAGHQFADQAGMGGPKMIDQVVSGPMSRMMGLGNPDLTRRAMIYQQGTQIDQARYGLLQAQAKIKELEAKLRDTKSIAPFDGVIVAKHIEKGATVMPPAALITYADTRHLQIKVDVPARLMPGIRKGMVVPAKLDVGNTRIDTRVSQIFPMADPQRHTVIVKLDLPPDAPGGPGMYAEVMVPDITAPIENLPTIPKSAVLWRGSLPAVFVVGGGEEPQLRMIRLGGFVDDQTVSVLSGLRVGERILSNPPTNIAKDWKTQEGTSPSSSANVQ
jgi:RND family efflux transporter MFP subunit